MGDSLGAWLLAGFCCNPGVCDIGQSNSTLLICILPKCRIGLRNCDCSEGITERGIVPGNLWFRQLLVGVGNGVGFLPQGTVCLRSLLFFHGFCLACPHWQ